MPGEEAPVLEQLKQIDTAVTDQLAQIKKQREDLESRLTKLDEEKAKVSEVVFKRVMEDYRSRLDALEKEASPLRDTARGLYAKVAALLERVEEVSRQTALDEEELDLRHRLGEFGEEEFKGRMKEVKERATSHKTDLTEIAKVRKKFVAAFDAEEDLARRPPTPAKPAAKATKPLSLSEEPPPIPKTVMAPLPPEISVPGADAPPEATVAPATKPQAAGPEKTRMLRLGRLIPLQGDAEVEEGAVTVQPITAIGRGSDNQLRIDETSVSRHHAQITLELEGFVLRDLASQNGTFVNGDPIKEKQLADGDRIQIGTARFVFRPA